MTLSTDITIWLRLTGWSAYDELNKDSRRLQVRPDVGRWGVSPLSCPWALQLSQDVPAYAGFLCVKAAIFRDTIKGTPLNTVSLVPGRNVGEAGLQDEILARDQPHTCSRGIQFIATIGWRCIMSVTSLNWNKTQYTALHQGVTLHASGFGYYRSKLSDLSHSTQGCYNDNHVMMSQTAPINVRWNSQHKQPF
jgi:hypothetical protein